jgi:hypothetical protein
MRKKDVSVRVVCNNSRIFGVRRNVRRNVLFLNVPLKNALERGLVGDLRDLRMGRYCSHISAGEREKSFDISQIACPGRRVAGNSAEKRSGKQPLDLFWSLLISCCARSQPEVCELQEN